MPVTHEVGAIWRIIDQGTPTLRAIGDALSKVDALAAKLQGRLEALGLLKFQGTTEALGLVGKAAESAEQKLVGLSDTRFAGINRGLTGVAERLERIETRAKGASSANGGMAALPSPAGGGGGGGQHVRPGQGGGGERRREGPGVDAGIFGFFGAEAVGHGMVDILKRGSELAHVQQQMTEGGWKAEEVAKATTASWQEASKYGLGVVQVMKDLKELRFPFGSTEHALEFIDPLEKMRVVLNSTSEGRGNESADAVYKMARAGELKGLTEPSDYMSYFDQMTKVISATGGKVGPGDFMKATQYGKLASFGWNEDFYTKYLPTMIQTMGASTAGQSLMSLSSTLVSGSVTKRSLGRMEDLGLIGDESKIVYDNFGQPKGFNPGAITGTSEFVGNPFAWAKDVLAPLLEKKFGDLSVAANKETAIENLAGIFGNRNSAASIAELALRSKSFVRDAGLTGEANGLKAADGFLANDPTAAVNRFKNSWENLLTSLGKPAVDSAVSTMNTLSSGIDKLAAFANEHPDAVKTLAGAFAGLAVGLGALSALALAAFLPGGAFIVAMISLGTALAGIAAVNWDKITDDFRKIKDFFAGVGDWIAHPFGGQSVPDASKAFQDDKKNMNGLFHHSAFVTGDAANDNPLTAAVRDGFIQAFQQISGGTAGAGSGVGGGSGIINAAYTTFGSSGAARGGAMGGLGSTGGAFAAGAPSGAVDVALGMVGEHEIRNRAQVNSFLNQHGSHIDAAQTAWCAAFVNSALDAVGIKGTGSLAAASFERWGRSVGLNDVHKGDVIVKNHHVGLATGEVDKFGRIGMVSGNHGNAVGQSWEDPRGILGVRRAVPTAGAPPRQQQPSEIHNHIHLDGKQIQASVTRRQKQMAMFPTAVGGMDTYGSFASPGTPMTDAA